MDLVGHRKQHGESTPPRRFTPSPWPPIPPRRLAPRPPAQQRQHPVFRHVRRLANHQLHPPNRLLRNAGYQPPHDRPDDPGRVQRGAGVARESKDDAAPQDHGKPVTGETHRETGPTRRRARDGGMASGRNIGIHKSARSFQPSSFNPRQISGGSTPRFRARPGWHPGHWRAPSTGSRGPPPASSAP